jgi:hypothetical protein
MKKLTSLSLMAGTFFCPLGYDIIFKILMDWTGGYWPTIVIFYCLSALFFGLAFVSQKYEIKGSENEDQVGT